MTSDLPQAELRATREELTSAQAFAGLLSAAEEQTACLSGELQASRAACRRLQEQVVDAALTDAALGSVEAACVEATGLVTHAVQAFMREREEWEASQGGLLADLRASESDVAGLKSQVQEATLMGDSLIEDLAEATRKWEASARAEAMLAERCEAAEASLATAEESAGTAACLQTKLEKVRVQVERGQEDLESVKGELAHSNATGARLRSRNAELEASFHPLSSLHLPRSCDGRPTCMRLSPCLMAVYPPNYVAKQAHSSRASCGTTGRKREWKTLRLTWRPRRPKCCGCKGVLPRR